MTSGTTVSLKKSDLPISRETSNKQPAPRRRTGSNISTKGKKSDWQISSTTMDRSSKTILRKVIIDFFCVFIVGISVLMFFLFGKPYRRGYYCNDESLNHPFHESTVTSAMLYVTGLFLPICTMIVGEFLHSRQCSGHSSMALFGHTIPSWLVQAYCKIGIFGFGAASSVLTTDIAKYTIGRLRPYFLTVCVPNIDCGLIENHHRYIENYHCTANLTMKQLKEMRLSFPSGHSSFSAYTMVFLAIYLQLRMTWKGSTLLKHILQLTCLLMAWFTAMSRVSDYKHHWSDVLAGLTLGTVIAIIISEFVAGFRRERRQCAAEEKRPVVEYEADAGTQDETRPLRTRKKIYNAVTTADEDGSQSNV